MDSIEAALLYALRHLGQPISAAALRSRAAKLPGPWSMDDLCEAAEGLGYRAESFVAPVESWGHFPLVVPLSGNEEGEVVVVTAVGQGEVELYSHEQGKSKISLAEAENLLSDHVILLSNQARVVQDQQGKPIPQGRYGHWFFGPLLQAKRLYLQVGLAAFLTNLFAVATSIFTMTVYDRVIPNQAIDTLWALLIGVGIVFLSDFIIRSLRSYFLDVAGARADMVIGDALFEQVLDMQFAARKGATGSLANVLKEFESLREFLTSTTLVTLIDIPFSILFLVLIWMIGGPMVWVPLAVIPLMIVAGLIVQPRLRQLTQAAFEDGQQKQSILVETIGGLETIKSLGAGAVMRHRWQQAVLHQSELGLKQRMWSSFAANIANFSQQIVQVGVVTVGFFLIGEGQLGFGAIIASTILAGRSISPLAQLSQLLSRLNQSLSSYKALKELMGRPREHTTQTQFVAREQLNGRVEFRDVHFTYPGADRPALNGVSFELDPGERVAVLGKIGSGKTTIAKLILGLYEPDQGAVLVDGVDVRQIDPADLRRNVGAVLQDVWLMSGTLRDNITLGMDEITDEQMLNAARISGVEDFVSQHPQGYGMKVGERGEGLSGGQRQAVTVARAIAPSPPIWLFDEPTSSMDQAAEEGLVKRLQQAQGDHTMIIVTHKPAMIALVNKVIVVDQGKVIYFGSPEKVLNK